MQVQSNVPHLINSALNCVTVYFGSEDSCLYVQKKVSLSVVIQAISH